jgi:REP element-mobilizing transposase RayT
MTYTKRHLPHWQPAGQDIFITWRLYGSLPARIKRLNQDDPAGKRFLAYDSALDSASVGPVWLNDPHVAESLIETITTAQGPDTFTLRAYVIMTNHVHVLLEPRAPLAVITQKIKGATARQANRILDRTGTPFWQDESFDHWIRNPTEWQKIRNYIEQNPVKAGLVKRAEEWPWSSASRTGFSLSGFGSSPSNQP